MTTNKPEVVMTLPGGEQLIRLRDYEALEAECALLRDQRNALAMHKIAAHQLIGIPASVGICEPIEGFAARPQDILPAVRDMALKIEALQAECKRLQAERDKLCSIISDIKDWDCDVSGGFLSIPVGLRRRIQEALATHQQGGGE